MSYTAELGPFFGSRDQDGLEQYGMTEVMLADPAWRIETLIPLSVPTQEFYGYLIADSVEGLLISRFAMGPSVSDLNIVVWN